jgi:hypothetical protein
MKQRTFVLLCGLLASSVSHAQEEASEQPDSPGPDIEVESPHPPPPDDYYREPPPSPPRPTPEEDTTAWRSDACYTTSWGRPIGPLQVPLLDGMLGAAHRECPRTEIALGGDAYLVADTASFYGNIRVNGRVSGSVRIARTAELFFSFETVRWQSLISAVSAGYLGLGYLSVGGRFVFVRTGQVIATLGHRGVFPTTTGLDQHAIPWGNDLGVTVAWAMLPNIRIHYWLNALLLVTLSGNAPSLARGGMRTGLGVDWHPYDWLAFVVEVGSGFAFRDALDFISLQPGVRLAFGPEVALELSATFPVLGAERALGAAYLSLSWRPSSPRSENSELAENEARFSAQ